LAVVSEQLAVKHDEKKDLAVKKSM